MFAQTVQGHDHQTNREVTADTTAAQTPSASIVPLEWATQGHVAL